jgi:hypothetical protein
VGLGCPAVLPLSPLPAAVAPLLSSGPLLSGSTATAVVYATKGSTSDSLQGSGRQQRCGLRLVEQTLGGVGVWNGSARLLSCCLPGQQEGEQRAPHQHHQRYFNQLLPVPAAVRAGA